MSTLLMPLENRSKVVVLLRADARRDGGRLETRFQTIHHDRKFILRQQHVDRSCSRSVQLRGLHGFHHQHYVREQHRTREWCYLYAWWLEDYAVHHRLHVHWQLRWSSGHVVFNDKRDQRNTVSL